MFGWLIDNRHSKITLRHYVLQIGALVPSGSVGVDPKRQRTIVTDPSSRTSRGGALSNSGASLLC